VEDVGDLIGGWLERLQSGPGAPMVVVAVGAGGTVEMSRAFSHGVDDYHFTANPVEQLLQRALARVSAKMRQMSVPVLRIGPYVLDRSRSVLASSGGEIHLSPREFSFVHSLIEAQGGTVQMERLCERICGQMNGAARRAVRQHAHVVRRKLSLVAASIGRAEALRVESVYGQGYRLAFEWREAAPL
jgi:two-component system KDP operon response regulator KdpE